MSTIGTRTYYDLHPDHPSPLEAGISGRAILDACRQDGCCLLGRIQDDGSVQVDHVTPGARSSTAVFVADRVDPETFVPQSRARNAWIRACHEEGA